MQPIQTPLEALRQVAINRIALLSLVLKDPRMKGDPSRAAVLEPLRDQTVKALEGITEAIAARARNDAHAARLLGTEYAQPGDAQQAPGQVVAEDPNKMLNTEEVTTLLSISAVTIHRMRTRGTGPRVFTLGVKRGYRYRLGDVRAWQEAGGNVTP